jgi:hypothetical protein
MRIRGVALLVLAGLLLGHPAHALMFSSSPLPPGISQGAIESTVVVPVPPAIQTLAAGGTITSDACGTLKRVTAAGAVSTDTADSFTPPATAPIGCQLTVCNVGTVNTITLKHNTDFFTLAGGDLALAANTCVIVVNDGVQWRQVTGLLTAN